jgi:hypothetical protein
MSTPTTISIATGCVSLIAVLWSVLSWRRSGPRVLVRAAACGSTVRITVCNAGRSPDAVSLVYLGGRVFGTGRDVTPTNLVPHQLEPTSPLEVDVPLDPVQDAAQILRCRLGYESVFVGLGSLRHVRSDVIPVPRLTAATAHQMWRRPGVLRRYGPLLAAVCAAASTATTSERSGAAVAAVTLLAGACLGGWYFTLLRRQTYLRARVERWLTAIGLATAAVLAGSAAPAGTPDRRASIAVDVLLALGWLSVIPTLVSTGLTAGQNIARTVRGRLPGSRHVRVGP